MNRHDFNRAWTNLNRRFPFTHRTEGSRYLVLGISHGLGDIIASTPAIRHYHSQGYRVLLPCWAQYQVAFKNMPEIDRFITIPPRCHEWSSLGDVRRVADAIRDQVDDVDGDVYVCSGFHKWTDAVQSRLPYYRIYPSAEWNSERCRAFNLMTNMGVPPPVAELTAGDIRLAFDPVETSSFDVVLSMGSQDRLRRFKPEMVRELASKIEFTIVGGVHDDEREIIGDVPAFDPVMRLPINHVLSAISRAGLMISPDTGLTHAALAMGISTVTFQSPEFIHYPHDYLHVHECDLWGLTATDVISVINKRHHELRRS